MRKFVLLGLLVLSVSMLFGQTVQQRLDGGESPCEIYNDGLGEPLDSLYGRTYQGGLIFHFDPTSSEGLILAPEDLGPRNWRCEGVLVGTGTAVGTGQSNTTAIINNACHAGDGLLSAAEVCDQYDDGTYSDWFLPSKDEALLMYTNLAANGFGTFSGQWHWTSSEQDATSTFRISFVSGAQPPDGKDDTRRVRAVRAFACVTPSPDIPTMSQWSLFLFGLIILTLGLVFGYNVWNRKAIA